MAGIGTAGMAGAGLLAGCGRASGVRLSSASVLADPPAAAITDADILNFALNLEYLEAEFYTYATTGSGISAAGLGTSGTGTQGNVTGGMKVSFPDNEHRDIFNNVAQDERDHVTTLRAALGSGAVAEPAINLGALGFGFGTFNDFLNLARLFEDTGVAAYSGAAPLLKNKMYLGVAARIVAIEGEHSGNIREQVILFEADQAASAQAIAKLDLDLAPPTDGIYFSSYHPTGLGRPRPPDRCWRSCTPSRGRRAAAFSPTA